VGGVGEVVALWSCGGLSSVLLLDGAALCGQGVGPSGLVAGSLPKLLVLTCSCLTGPLVGVGPYVWRCSLMECPCAVSLIAVDSFTLFTVGCGCTVKLVLCLLCGSIFPCVVRAIAGHLYCWSEFSPEGSALPRAYCVICEGICLGSSWCRRKVCIADPMLTSSLSVCLLHHVSYVLSVPETQTFRLQ